MRKCLLQSAGNGFGEQTFDALLAFWQIIVEAGPPGARGMRTEHVNITVDTRRHLRCNTILRCSWLMAIRDPAVLHAAQSVQIQADDSKIRIFSVCSGPLS